jgi:uncharacterized membrane protein YkvA (DUF1232 family)
VTESVRPDEVIPPDGNPVPLRRFAADAVLMIPNLAKLISRLLRDPRVPRRAKVSLGLAAAYVVSPIDLIPEVIPVFGILDDILIMVLALDALIDRSGPEVVREHWDGPGDVLDLITDAMAMSRTLLPKRISSVIDRMSG